MSHVCLNQPCLQRKLCKFCNQKTYLLHELLICVFSNIDFLKKKSQIVHSNGFFSSWTKTSCTSKLALFTKLAPQILHSKGICLSWTLLFEIVFICRTMQCSKSKVVEELNIFWTKSTKLPHSAVYIGLIICIPDVESHWLGLCWLNLPPPSQGSRSLDQREPYRRST